VSGQPQWGDDPRPAWMDPAYWLCIVVFVATLVLAAHVGAA